MAPEATADKPVDASVTEPVLTQATEPDSQNVDEIQNKQIAEIVDELVNSAETSVSGGSDTEASKVKSSDKKGHGRTSSTIKKPQSFKSVSVNRSFLASKGAVNPTSRPESTGSATSTTTPTPVASSGSKLKLVAKSNTSLGGSTKTLASNGKTTSAPDPNTVWNKNRPVPQPEPKKLSDEELMSKYGIHMADRLRPEDDRGQSNWADIDDDEEWAPDTITWTDGTKITLPQVEENPPTPSAAPAVLAKDSQTEKPKSPAPSASPNARASPSVKPGVLTSGKGLVLKGAPEKPTLVAKIPALSTPVKSPWASVGPIERAPIPVDVPNQHQQQAGHRGYPPRDAPMVKSMTPPPAKEIAADDFSRSSWREGQAGGNRELFNSQSGRYEPVNDRRGSRHDPRGHPALLQRPHPHDQGGAAEPSAAFQTSRTSGQDPLTYGRRRGSSNVSGGSGSLAGRLGKPQEIAAPELHQTGGAGSPVSGSFSPAVTHPTPRTHAAQPWQPRRSPGQVHSVPAYSAPEMTPVSQPSVEEELELQKKLMRERRELAIKRRMEEEAREEAARKERIRLKLEAMGPPPERKSNKKDEANAPTQIQQRDTIPAALMSKAELAERQVTLAEAKQSVVKSDSDSKLESQVNGAAINSADKHQADPSLPASAPGSQTTATWPEKHQPSERLASWSSSIQTTSRNVWAAPGNDRSLGNGTFNADLGNLADSQPAEPSTMVSRPAPIAPPRATSQNQQRPDTGPGRIAPIAPPSRSQVPGAQRPASRNPWVNADIAADDRVIRLESQKRMEEQMKGLAGQGATLDDAQASVRDTWRSVNINDDGKRTKVATTTSVHGEPKGAPNASWNTSTASNAPHRVDRHEAMAPPISQDYRQQPGPNGMRHDYGRRPPMPPAGDATSGHMPQSRAGSRFFPQPGPRDIRSDETSVQSRSKSPTPPPPTMDDHPAYDGDAARPHVSLPPTRPVVKLPPAAVRLPSASAAAAPAPIAPPRRPASFAAAVAAGPPRSASQSTTGRPPSHGSLHQRPHEITTQESWQEKINSLMGRTRVSPAKPMSVDSASKSAFDYAHSYVSATVSLPSLSSASSTSSDYSSFTSREMAEECFGEQEMGSLPQVRLPNDAPDALWHAVEPNWGPLVSRLRVDATASETHRFPYESVNNKSVIRISVPGMGDSKTVPAPFPPRVKSNSSRRQPSRGARHVSRGGQRGGRESSNFSGDHSLAPSSERPERSDRLSSTRGRGSFRGRSENWSRHNSTAQTAQT
ncbi:uncharacterized protein BCR38DRAFT_412713 [Pseudomassariella vexata]|uniref:Uncharacterized protein n=1 Tax=Pseudomassariella vexata TaxID=1141098 RepID=A0A1Y2DKB0_9PEZI|nr:uncharacterized protein BCR38DRAFT_412713 [Pseudomassariella vexata]ORY59718.1 hypothetical protein BCR38DRAFT_412713 [Pseudomassariella vexata]